MVTTKTPIYITKDEAIKAIKGCRNKEEMEWAIRSIKATKMKRSKRMAHVFTKGPADEEFCPHCKRSVDVFCLNKKVPKYVYCFWCGSAIERDFGPKNPLFDKKILEAYEKEKENAKMEEIAKILEDASVQP